MPNLTESPSLLRREATSLATAAVLRTASRMLRMTRQITPDSEVEQWHRLRIRAKRFRYLLAAFEPLMAEAQANESPTGLPAAGQLIVSLKALQRGLGELNDLAVHQQSLDELIDGAGRAAETLPWQRLEQWLGDRQVVLMEVLHPSLLEFRGQVQDSLEGLVPAP